jgi:hypothetical protein
LSTGAHPIYVAACRGQVKSARGLAQSKVFDEGVEHDTRGACDPRNGDAPPCALPLAGCAGRRISRTGAQRSNAVTNSSGDVARGAGEVPRGAVAVARGVCDGAGPRAVPARSVKERLDFPTTYRRPSAADAERARSAVSDNFQHFFSLNFSAPHPMNFSVTVGAGRPAGSTNKTEH